MDINTNRVAEILRNPTVVKYYSPQDWDLLIPQARSSLLLARLYQVLLDHDLFDPLPTPVKNHFISASAYTKKLNGSINWEFRCIEKALHELDIPVILLKGSAYLLAKDRAAQGRLFSDIDILVSKKKLSEAERILKKHGWVSTHQNDYDQRYYRQWMHELPPMVHIKRQTMLDVHHNILPTTCKSCPDSQKLVTNIVKLEGTGFWVLSSEDRVLHSAAHLFHEGEFKHGLRDISDIDLLLRQFSDLENFWSRLFGRAVELDQQISLYYALRYTSKILATPLPNEALATLTVLAPCSIKQWFMDFLFLRALMPDHPSCEDRWTAFARWLLFVRGHYLRMPLRLFIPHLLRKSYRRLKERNTL